MIGTLFNGISILVLCCINSMVAFNLEFKSYHKHWDRVRGCCGVEVLCQVTLMSLVCLASEETFTQTMHNIYCVCKKIVTAIFSVLVTDKCCWECVCVKDNMCRGHYV